MSSLLVFTRLSLQAEDTVNHVGIFDPSFELAPLQPSHWFTSLPFPPSLSCVKKYTV
jgi:hypothetical protein